MEQTDEPQIDEETLNKELSQAYRNVFGTEEGKRVLNDIMLVAMDRTDICVPTTTTGNLDPLFLAAAAGRQYVASHIYLRLNPKEEGDV